MATTVTLESALSDASSLEHGEWRDAILFHLEKMDFNAALMVCGDAVLANLKRETDLSVAELKKRMLECSRLEKLEKKISCLARQAREVKRLRRGQLDVGPRHPAA